MNKIFEQETTNNIPNYNNQIIEIKISKIVMYQISEIIDSNSDINDKLLKIVRTFILGVENITVKKLKAPKKTKI